MTGDGAPSRRASPGLGLPLGIEAFAGVVSVANQIRTYL